MERTLATHALNLIRETSTSVLAERDSEGQFTLLQDRITLLRSMLHELSDTLSVSYLSPLRTSRLTSLW
jgi:hypothetical protein